MPTQSTHSLERPSRLKHMLGRLNEQSELPTMEELFFCLAHEQERPEVDRYLRDRPELKHALESIIHTVRTDSHNALELAAYYRFKERDRRETHPLHARDVRAWLEAEYVRCNPDHLPPPTDAPPQLTYHAHLANQLPHHR